MRPIEESTLPFAFADVESISDDGEVVIRLGDGERTTVQVPLEQVPALRRRTVEERPRSVRAG